MMKYLVLSASLLAIAPASWALTYGDLLPKVIDHFPQKQQGLAFQSLANSNQKFADSWIAGDVEINLRHENANLIGNQSDQSWELGASFPIWKSGQTDSLGQLGQTYQTLTELSQQTLKLSASGKLRQLVWAYKKAQIQLKFAQQNLQQTESLVDFIAQKVNAGESPKFDLLMAQKTMMQFQQTVSQQKTTFAIANQNLIRWTGQNQLPTPLAEMLVENNAAHPQSDFNRLLVAVEKAKLNWVKSQKSNNPSVFVGARSETSNEAASPDMQYLMAEITLPLGLDPGAQTRTAEQNQQLSAAQIRQANVKQQLELSLLEAKQTLTSAKQVEQLAQQQLTLSKEAMLLAETAYKQGETTIQELLLAKTQFFDDQLNSKLAKLNQLEAIANLNQAQGVILE
mgnify:CR=1 FL=1